MARPSKYKKKFCRSLTAYFRDAPYFEVVEEAYYDKKAGEFRTCEKKVPARCPTLVRFAESIKVNPDTLQEWADRYPEFASAKNAALKYQEEWLMNAAGLGVYNSTIATMALKSNHGWTDRMNNTGDSSITIVSKKYNYDGSPEDETAGGLRRE